MTKKWLLCKSLGITFSICCYANAKDCPKEEKIIHRRHELKKTFSTLSHNRKKLASSLFFWGFESLFETINKNKDRQSAAEETA